MYAKLKALKRWQERRCGVKIIRRQMRIKARRQGEITGEKSCWSIGPLIKRLSIEYESLIERLRKW